MTLEENPNAAQYTLEMAAHTDIGKVRSTNEDAVWSNASYAIAILADGMGGHRAGDVAAQMLVKRLVERLPIPEQQSRSRAEIAGELLARVEQVNEEIYQSACREARYTGMCSTLVMGLFCRDFLLTAHVGDSRCYRLRQGELTPLTRDHSLLQMQIDAGLIRPEDARFSSIKNLITRAVGIESVVEAECNGYDVEADDIYLFSSDGLHDLLPEPEITLILETHADDPDTACIRLIEQANARGGHDNISVIVAKICTSRA
ncbi:MAG: protein phosphatase 2C domain-containing protein [Zoogloeaceae bacterium]|jgi:protein phosphatase|nr:protein phosphatase 2C domain-containing protein [Zoogloeaceae bacterium]